MRICAALLFLSACSAEPNHAADANQAGATDIGALAPVNQVAVAQSRPADDSAAAKIMAGGFRPDGSFVHGDHIHQAGQEKCPSEMGGGPVQ